MKEYIFHGVIEKEGDVFCTLCLELDIATDERFHKINYDSRLDIKTLIYTD